MESNELQPLLAFGGNDRASRSARARLQWRDRYGKFIEMGRGVKFKVRLPNMPNPVSVVGKFVGTTDNPNYGQVYVSNHTAGLPDGFYTVQSSNAAATVAQLTPDELAKEGISLGKDVNGNLISSRTDKDVQSFADLHYSTAPLGWSQAKDGSFSTADGSFKVKNGGGTNGYALYHNNNFVGFYNKNDWDQILKKADDLDTQEEEQDKNASAPSATPDVDHKAEAKAAIAPYDKTGSASSLVDQGKPAPEVLAHLRDNSPEYQALRQQAGSQGRTGYRGPVQKQAQGVLNDIQAKLHAAHDNHGKTQPKRDPNQRVPGLAWSGKSKDGIELPYVKNQSNDTTTYAVPQEGQQIGGPTKVANLNRTEYDIYNARKEVARQDALLQSAEAGVNGPGRLDGAPNSVQARRQAAAQKNLDARREARAEAQANLDKLEKAAGLQQKDAPQINNDSNSNVVDAQSPIQPAEKPALADSELETPLVTNDDSTQANVSTPSQLDPAPYQPKNNLPDGTTDDPKQIAQDFNKADLQSAFTEAVASGDSDVRLQFPNGTAASIPTEAVRDALQHQGQDTNTDTNPDPQITTQDALDALPAGSKVQRGTITLTKDDKGSWVSPKGAVYQNLMQTSSDNNLKLTLLDNAGDKNAPSVATPVVQTDTAPAPKDGPTFKPTRLLQRGDEVANGTILNVYKTTRTPRGKSEVIYLDNRGNIRQSQWNDGTQIGIVKRPARTLPGDKTAAPATPAQDATPAAPTPTPNAPAAPAAPKPGAHVAPAQTMKRSNHELNVVLKDFQIRALKDGDSVYFYAPQGGLGKGLKTYIATRQGNDFVDQDGNKHSLNDVVAMTATSGDSFRAVRYAGKNATKLPDGAFNPATEPHHLNENDRISLDDFKKLVPGDRFKVGANKISYQGTYVVSDDGKGIVNTQTNKSVPRERFDDGGSTMIYLGNDKTDNAAPTPADNAPAPTPTPTPQDTSAPQPPVVSTDANQNAVVVPNAPTPAPTPAAKDDTPPTDKELAKHLAKTRVNPGGDPFLDMALDDVNNNADPSPLAIAYVNSKMKDAPKIQAPAPAAQDNTPAAPTPTAPATPDAPTPPTPAPNPAPAHSIVPPNGANIFDADLVLAEVRKAYPNRKELKNGDIILGSREITGPKGARKRYDLVVTRTGNEYFYTYVRETDLTDGTAKSQRFGPMVHSAKALDTRINVGLSQINNSKVGTWFNSRARRPFVKDDEINPATGEREHLKEQPVLDATISDIHKSINDNQISEDLIRNVYDVISTLGTSKRTRALIATQHNLSSDKVNKLVDAINLHVNSQNAKKQFQVWVSSDGVTPLFEGDIVEHKSGRRGRIVSRIVDHGTKGYGYPDYVFFQEVDDNGNDVGNQRNMTSRFMTIIRTAQGTDGSERIGQNAVALPAPTPSTRAANKIARQNAMRQARQNVKPPTPNQTVIVNNTGSATPTVNVNGTDHALNLTRTHTTQNDTPVNVPASQAQPNDIVQIYDPSADTNRLGQIVDVKPNDNGSGTTLTSVVPDDQNSGVATVVTTNVPGDGTVAALRPAQSTDASSPASDQDMDRLRDAYNKADLQNVSVDGTNNDFVMDALRALLSDGNGSTKGDIDALVDKLSKAPQRQNAIIDTKASLQNATDIAQSVADDNPQATDLQNAIDQAKITVDQNSTPHGRVQSIIDENSQVTDLSKYQNVGRQLGSNPGGTYRDPATGDRIYLKFQSSQDRTDNEVLASALYRAVGQNAATILRGKRSRERRPISYSPIMELDSYKRFDSQLRNPAFAQKVHDGFAIDAWLANWDATVNNNISVDTNGNPVYMDLGGALRYRARGQLKPNFGNTVDELQTLTNGRNRNQYAAYGRMTEADKKRSAEKLLNINDSEIDALVKEISGKTLGDQQAQELADTLKARRKFILNTYNIPDTQDATTPNVPAQNAPAAPAPSNAAPGSPYDPATIAAANPGSDANVKWGNPKAEAKGIPMLSGYAVKTDSDGTHYVDQWNGNDAELIRKGQLAVPALPFKMKGNPKPGKEGDMHFYDMSGTRRWGSLGAAGAMIRRKNADGTYSFLMAQRGSTLSTDPNTWSIITGANSNHADAADPVLTARKELGEEVKVDPNDINHTHNLDVNVDPAWKFTYSFFDLDPAAADKYAKVKVKQSREIQQINWVSEAELLQFSKDGKLHSAFSPQIVADIKRLSDQNAFSYGQNGTPNAPSAPVNDTLTPSAPATPAAPNTPNVPETPAASTPTPEPEPEPVAPSIPDGKTVTPQDVSSAQTGQIVRTVPSSNSGPRSSMEFIKTDTGWKYHRIGGTIPPADDPNVGDAKDQTDLVNRLAEGNATGNSGALHLVAGAQNIKFEPVDDGKPVDQNWEISAPEGTIAHSVDAATGKRYEFAKQADGTWKNTADSDPAEQGVRLSSPTYISTNADDGNLFAGPLPARDEGTLGLEVDENWVRTVKSGAHVTFKNSVSGSFITLGKINKNEWTDGQNIFTNDSVNRLRNGGRVKMFSGPVPDLSNQSPDQGKKLNDYHDLDAFPAGAIVHFKYRGNQYESVKQANDSWISNPIDKSVPVSFYDSMTNKEASSRQIFMYADYSVRQGAAPTPLEQAARAQTTPSDARVSLGNQLNKVDPQQHIASVAPLGFMSDDQINALNAEIGQITNNYTTQLSEDQAHALIDKYRPQVPQDIQGWLALSDGLANEVDQLRALAGESDQSRGAENLEFAHANYVLAAISSLRGYDKKPTKIDKSDRSSFGPGVLKVYRGVKGYRGRTPKEMLDQFRDGDTLFAGSGVYGNGTYTSTWRQRINEYTTRYETDNKIVIGLPLDKMKILEFEDSNGRLLKSKYRDEFNSEVSKFLSGKGLQPGTPEYEKAYKRIYDLFTEQTKSGNRRTRGRHIDIGVYAALMGYDAIRKHGPRRASYSPTDVGGNNQRDEIYYILLNRGKLIIGNGK